MKTLQKVDLQVFSSSDCTRKKNSLHEYLWRCCWWIQVTMFSLMIEMFLFYCSNIFTSRISIAQSTHIFKEIQVIRVIFIVEIMFSLKMLFAEGPFLKNNVESVNIV